MTGNRRGILIFDQSFEDETGFQIRIEFRPEYLRTMALFYDHLDWPLGWGDVDRIPDLAFCNTRGLGRSVQKRAIMSDTPHGMIDEVIWSTLGALRSRDGGKWTFGLDALTPLPMPPTVDPEGVWTARLNDALIIPDRETPLDAVLSFQHRRRPELVAMRTRIEELARAAALQGIESTEAQAAIKRFEAELVNYSRVGQEQNFGKSVASFDFSTLVSSALEDLTTGHIAHPLEALAKFGINTTINFIRGAALKSAATGKDEAFLFVTRAFRELY